MDYGLWINSSFFFTLYFPPDLYTSLLAFFFPPQGLHCHLLSGSVGCSLAVLAF